MTVDEVLAIATPGFEEAIDAEDANDDDLLCVKLLPEPIPSFEPTFLYYDNNRHSVEERFDSFGAPMRLARRSVDADGGAA